MSVPCAVPQTCVTDGWLSQVKQHQGHVRAYSCLYLSLTIVLNRTFAESNILLTKLKFGLAKLKFAISMLNIAIQLTIFESFKSSHLLSGSLTLAFPFPWAELGKQYKGNCLLWTDTSHNRIQKSATRNEDMGINLFFHQHKYDGVTSPNCYISEKRIYSIEQGTNIYT